MLLLVVHGCLLSTLGAVAVPIVSLRSQWLSDEAGGSDDGWSSGTIILQCSVDRLLPDYVEHGVLKSLLVS